MVYRLTSRRDINVYVVICDKSADRVLEENINQKTNASALAIDGALLDEMGGGTSAPEEMTIRQDLEAISERFIPDRHSDISAGNQRLETAKTPLSNATRGATLEHQPASP